MRPYYEEENITIYHGDCLEILSQLPKVDLVLTDPPYGVDKFIDRIGNSNWEWIELCRRLSKLIISFNGHCNIFEAPKPDGFIIWYKSNSNTPGGRIAFRNVWEPISIYGRIHPPLDRDLIEHPISLQNDIGNHPTPKPLSLFKKIITKLASSGFILDPFMGSGTTLVAAKQLGRQAIGIEIEEKYCEIAAKRLSQEVMNFAPKEAGGKPAGNGHFFV